MGLVGAPPERYWMKDGVYLPKNGLPPAAYFGKTCFQKIYCVVHVSVYTSQAETPEDLPCLHSQVDMLLEQLWVFLQQYCIPGSNVNVYNPPPKWWRFTGAEHEKASRQQEYECKCSKFYSSSCWMSDRAWYTSHCWYLQQAQSWCVCGWLVSNQLYTQLIFRCKWHFLNHWTLVTALSNSLILNQDLPVNNECTVEQFEFRPFIVDGLLQARSPSTMNSSPLDSSLITNHSVGSGPTMWLWLVQ